MSKRSVTAAQDLKVIAEIEQMQQSLHGSGREAMGVTGEHEATGFWSTLREHKLSVYPALALGLLFLVDSFQGVGFSVLAPEIRQGLGVSRTAVALMLTFSSLALVLMALPMAAAIQGRPIRALLAKITGITWSVATLFTGFVTNIWQLGAVSIVDGGTSGAVVSIHPPLLLDSYPPSVRARVLSIYYGFFRVGQFAAPLYVALLAGPFDLTWRGVFLVMGATAVALSLSSLALRDPGFGRWDTTRLRERVRSQIGEEGTPDRSAYELHFFEISRRVLAMPTIRRILAAYALTGLLQAPLNIFLSFFVAERWNLDPSARGFFFALLPLFGIAGLFVFSKFNDRLYRGNPADLFGFAAALQAATAILIAVSVFSPFFWGLVLALGLSVAAVSPLFATIATGYFSIVRPEHRPHVSALVGIFEYGVGGIAGALLLGSLADRYGTTWSLITVVLVFGLASAAVLFSVRRLINSDLDRTVSDLIEEEELQAMEAKGVELPMLACRKVDFFYGQMQVLFNIDFTVDEGEMVALLGTNGAGKSTLLRVVSGLGLPMKGSVRYRGGDITFLEPPRRVKLGITQVPGGRSVFGPLSVIDNLRMFGYSHGRDRREVERGIEASLQAFPRLADRRNQPASTLSGGEQQMLGLSKAFILKPKLLLVDELSLGLAPKIVAELLAMLKRLNTDGTAIVLVEQSVNLALSVVDHAYFMEKGEIKFDGRAQDLLKRSDLLRSVFLEGAAKGLKTNGQRPAGLRA